MAYADPLTPALLAALRAQLASDERLAWAASPEPAAFARKSRGVGKRDAVAILGGGYATIAAVVMALRTGHWLWLSVPLSLVACGVAWFLTARWIQVRARKSRAGTAYALTTRRALILETHPSRAVQALPLEEITDVRLQNERGAFADLWLCTTTTSSSAGLVLRGIAEPERARTQLLRVIRDPQATEQEIAAAEAYSMAMSRLMPRPISS